MFATGMRRNAGDLRVVARSRSCTVACSRAEVWPPVDEVAVSVVPRRSRREGHARWRSRKMQRRRRRTEPMGRRLVGDGPDTLVSSRAGPDVDGRHGMSGRVPVQDGGERCLAQQCIPELRTLWPSKCGSVRKSPCGGESYSTPFCFCIELGTMKMLTDPSDGNLID